MSTMNSKYLKADNPAKRKKVSFDTPACQACSEASKTPAKSCTTNSVYEPGARLLESLLFVFKHSTHDAIDLFLLQIRNPCLRATDLLQAFTQLVANCQCDSHLISACLFDVSLLTHDDLVSLSNCLTAYSTKSSPGKTRPLLDLSTDLNEPGDNEYKTQQPVTNRIVPTLSSVDFSHAAFRQTTITFSVPDSRQIAHPIHSFHGPCDRQTRYDKILPQPSQIATASNPLDGPDIRVYDVPLLDPQGDFSIYCLDIRNSGRRALSRGATLSRMSSWGRVDCELLFRDRVAEDDWNIPGWACEVCRRLPPMTPATRLAFAVIFTRVMTYLISPSIDTWRQLPAMLRPTNVQMQNSHDISVSFAPIPRLRDCLIENPTDWLLVWLKNDCGMQWPGSWGNAGEVKFTEVGNWKDGSSCGTKAASNSCIETLKAVEYDSQTGRRYISNDFQTWCCDSLNWFVSEGVLKTWPELFGHIPVTGASAAK